MKKLIMILISIVLSIGVLLLSIFISTNDLKNKKNIVMSRPVVVVQEKKYVYENYTMDELVKKLDVFLQSSLLGTAELYATYSLESGVDPFLAVAITQVETGCKTNCSHLVKSCNNVGGMKGGPSCNGGSFKKFISLEDGIKSFIDLLKNGYYDKGLDNPILIGQKYAGSTIWAEHVMNYMEQIKTS